MKLILKLSDMIALIYKQKMRLLLIELFFGILLFLILGQLYYNFRKKEFCEKVEGVFKEVLLQQLQEDSFEGYFSTNERKKGLNEYPDTIYVIDKSGTHGYYLDKEKSRKNITSDPRLRSLHSNYLSRYPLVVDSLFEKGQQHLKYQNLSSIVALQLLTSDKNGNITNSVAPYGFSFKDFIPCFDMTIGYRCEVEVKGFFASSFSNLMGKRALIYGFIYWLFIILIVVLFNRKKKLKNTTIAFTPAHIYQLGQNIMFDADQRKLVFGKEEISMRPQTAILLRHFLDTPGYILKDEEMKRILWSDKYDQDARLHNAISRLRRVFENIPSIEIQRYEKSGYLLQIRENG